MDVVAAPTLELASVAKWDFELLVRICIVAVLKLASRATLNSACWRGVCP